MTSHKGNSQIALVLGLIAIGIAIFNLGLLIGFAIIYRIIIESVVFYFFLGIGASAGSVIILWRLITSSFKWRRLIGTLSVLGIPFSGILILFFRANIDFSAERIGSLQLVRLTDLAFYLASMILTLFVGLLIYFGTKFIRDRYSNAKIKKSLLGSFQILIIIFPVIMLPFITMHFPIYPPKPHGDLEPGTIRSIDLFVSGTEGYYSYRIPSLLVLPNDTILAFAEGRKYSTFDMGNIDVVLKRSEDGGKTWSSLEVVIDAGCLKAGEPCPVYDNNTGFVWLSYCIEAWQVFLINSSDGGITWSNSWNITPYVKPDSWPKWFVMGPGHGIQLTKGPDVGRLLLPAYVDIPNSSVQHTLMIYSDNGGLSWHRGNYTTIGGENEVVETANGSIYMTIRPQFSESHRRLYSWSHDGGLNWGPVNIEYNLLDPKCQASIARLTEEDNSTINRIIFSNPSHTSDRRNMTIHLSYNECETWDIAKVLYSGNAGYSDLGVLSNKTICCFFEIGDESLEGPGYHDYHDYLIFVQFNVDWLETP
ncbi:MAG: exo-alpha-sialidase [Candidatus Helarchaeota archaeon]|nr:exo-alpha-sialidase [Candidatus Helarchaeota archaeon]